MYTSLYADETPTFLESLAHTPEMARLRDVGMHCGVEYADFSVYRRQRMPYSRWTHSMGVAKIVWNFTRDIRQAISGLLHDIATPVFAHTIDFLQGDYLTQASTEAKTLSLIEGSRDITGLLAELDVRVEEVADYHLYPIADNDTPLLSADRLEYTLGNGYCVYGMDRTSLHGIYSNLIVSKNEKETDELCFQSIGAAKRFTALSMRNARLFVSDEDRFSMQCLADILRFAVETGVLTPDDFYLTEPAVIGKLRGDRKLSEMWQAYTRISAVTASAEKPRDGYSVNIPAKKRYIDPLVLAGGTAKRLSTIDGDSRERMQAFLRMDFDRWVCQAR